MRREELFDLLDGIAENKLRNLGDTDVLMNGKGSSKNLKISRLLSRYQGTVNNFFRIFHTLDFYKRAASPEELAKLASVNDADYVENIIRTIKKSMLSGTISDFTQKLGVENCHEYRDLYNIGWALEKESFEGPTKQKGVVSESTKLGLEGRKKSNALERFQRYITRFRNIIANDKNDLLRPNHYLNVYIADAYIDIATTPESKFNLVAQSPVDMVQKGAGKIHADRSWLKKISIITGVVFGITLIAQFFFGKLTNKHNLQKIDNKQKQKQVENVPGK